MKNKKVLSLLVLFVWIGGINVNLFAQKRKTPLRKEIIVQSLGAISAAPSHNLTPELQRRVDTFNMVWQTVKNNYFDQTFSGLDWNKIKTEFEPRVLKTTTDAQLHIILQEMINRLNRSHFAIIPPEVYRAIEKAKADAKAKENLQKMANKKELSSEMPDKDDTDLEDFSGKFGIGIELRLINDQFVIVRIEKNSAAEKAGVKAGYVVEKINDVSLSELMRKIQTYQTNARNVKRYLPAQIVEWMLNGEKESSVTLTLSNESEQPKEIKIAREKLKGETVSLGKNFPEQFLKFETASLNEEVGFIKFNFFALPVIEKFCAALTELKNKKAIIIDLRGNFGGILGSMLGIGGMLTDKSLDLGTSLYKVGSENLVAVTKAKNYKGRLVFLVDNQTVSAAEIFAAALQENNRALIVGDKTAGEALPSISAQLPTGAVLLYPIANFKTRNGNFLEGKGVEPNFVVALDRKSLLDGKDNQLETALKIIKEDNAFPKSPEGAININGVAKNLPPPPPAALPPKGKQLGEVTVKIPKPEPTPAVINKKDEKALQIIRDFIGKIGGEEALSKINSYTLRGSTNISYRGSIADLDIHIFRQKPDKYAEVMKSDVVGEIREVYTGKKYFVQSDYGINQDFPVEADTAKIEIFAPINQLLDKDVFKALNYQGIFDRQGRKTHIIEAKTAENVTVALAFDVETKLLVSYVSQYYGISYDDYRQVENISLPFQIERENLMKIKIDEIKLNPAIEESSFSKKENCFDKAM